MSGRRLAGRWLAAVLAVATLMVAWAGLYRGDGALRLAGLCALAALPTVAAVSPRGRAAALAAASAAAVVGVAALAIRRSPIDLIALRADAWAEVRGILPDGLEQGAHAGLPVAFAGTPALVALLDVALAALAGAAVWQIVVRGRPVAGVVLIGVGLAYRWTVEPPASGAGAAVLALVSIAAILALATWDPERSARPLRRAGGAVVLGGAAVALAAALGSGPAQAGQPWWEWKQWDFGSAASVPSQLDLRQEYGTLDWPETPRVAFTVAASTSRPVRAVSLDGFDGESFTLVQGTGSPALPVAGGVIRAPADPTTTAAGSEEIVQRIRLEKARSTVILSSGRLQSVAGPFSGTADMVGGSIRLADELGPGDGYTVRARVPTPTPADLIAAPALAGSAAPQGETQLRPARGASPVSTPLWGDFGAAPTDAQLGAYADVRALAREVAGDARTEYAVVNRVEAYLRSRYTYDEAPPYPTSRPAGVQEADAGVPPPLADFLLNSRRGYCQHFAGGMAVMLRSLGIPARVAVGYTGGRFDAGSDRYVVLDRDAHSWVEVWFPTYGWLPFDPTPGRSAANPASVSSPDYAPSRFEVDLGGLAGAAVDPAPAEVPADEARTTPDDPGSTTDDDGAAAAAPGGGGGGGGGWWWVTLAPLGLVLVPAGARAARRARARRHGDERARVIAAAQEFEASLGRLGWAPPVAASAAERAADVRRRTGVDASALYRRAAEARYAPGPPPRGEAAAAWRELGSALRAIRGQASWRRRLAAALGPARRGRATVER